LYDPATSALIVDPRDELQDAALSALRENPVLARNVVMIAMRHSISDALGGAIAADLQYQQTYYGLGLDNLRSAPCDASTLPFVKLNELFPNWKFEHRVTEEEKTTSIYKDCPAEVREDISKDTPVTDLGAGIAISLGNFYVVVPSPLVLATGTFEQTNSLRMALFYRDRLSHAVVDQSIFTMLESSIPKSNIGTVAYTLLNEAWGWQVREKSQ
jgi:hypothetical protein